MASGTQTPGPVQLERVWHSYMKTLGSRNPSLAFGVAKIIVAQNRLMGRIG